MTSSFFYSLKFESSKIKSVFCLLAFIDFFSKCLLAKFVHFKLSVLVVSVVKDPF